MYIDLIIKSMYCKSLCVVAIVLESHSIGEYW